MVANTADLVADLIGVPWVAHGRDRRGIDCAGVCAVVLKRLGRDVPESAWTGENDSWEYLGDSIDDARQVGDVVVSKTSDGELHVSVLIETATRSFATASQKLGAVVLRYWVIQGVTGAYRWPR